MEWSHQLLPEDQQVLFRRLATFSGGFGLEAAERVAGLPPLEPRRVGALLAGLRERSMVVVERTPQGASRYRLLETLKDFAAERLRACGEEPDLRRRHFAHHLERAERVDRDRQRTGADAEVAALVPDADDYRAALAWSIEADPAGALRLAAALEGFWMIRSVAEGRRWLQRALEQAPGPTRHRARTLMVSPLVAAGGIPWPEAHRLVEESVRISESLGDERGAAMARLQMGLGAFFAGELDEARRRLEEAGRRHRELDHPLFHARAAGYLGAVLSFTPRRLEEGRRLLRQGAGRSAGIGDRWGQGMALTVLGLADLRRLPGTGAGAPAGRAADEPPGRRDRHRRGRPGPARPRSRRALTLLEAAVAIRERTGVPRLPVHIERQLEGARDAARRRVAPQLAGQCLRRARGLTTEEVLAYALAEEEPADGVEADRLTARQQEIAALVAEGLSNRQISERLHLSVRTVETHVNNILVALGFHSRVRLAGWARDAGLSNTTVT